MKYLLFLWFLWLMSPTILGQLVMNENSSFNFEHQQISSHENLTFLPTLFLNHQKRINNDSTILKDTLLQDITTTHGIYVEGVGRYIGYYSLGYEWVRIKNKNGLGLGIGTTANPRINFPSGRRYVNFYLGFSAFYEYGRNWGFRVGINEGINYNPITSTNKLNNAVPPDWPYIMQQTNSLFIGGFYRTKNLRWQFILTANTYYAFIQQQSFYNEKKWYGYFIPFQLGLTIKYNFKIKEK